MVLEEDEEAVAVLHTAAYTGDNDKIRQLLENGFTNINAGNFDSVTSLHLACLAGCASTVKLLISAGAEVNARNIDGATPLCEACCSGNKECVHLLLKNGALVNPDLLLSSPLHEAALRDNYQCIEILIQHKANMEAMDCHYGSSLHVCAFKNHVRAGQVLLRNGANVNATKMLESALHFSAQSKSEQFLSLLLDHGADIYARNNHGRRAIDNLSCKDGAYHLLANYMCNSRRLSHYCRLVIRKCLDSNFTSKINELPLPKTLRDFLDFRDNGIKA